METTNEGIYGSLQNRRTQGIKQTMYSLWMDVWGPMSVSVRKSLFRWFTTILNWDITRDVSRGWKRKRVFDIVDAGPNHCFLVLSAEGEWVKAHNCDYGSQEAYIAPILSGDKALLDAYISGDPYLAFAIATGAAPKDATKTSHKDIRTLYKSTVLGLQYGMGAAKLAIKLTADTGKKVTTDMARELINQHKEVYPRYYEWKEELWEQYRHDKRPLILRDGWYLDVDQLSRLSVLNFPVQGTGSSMMRVCIDLLYERGIELICPIHDSMVVECDEQDIDRVEKIVQECMLESSLKILGVDGMRVGDAEVVRHGEYWETEKNLYDLPKFKKYFESALKIDPNEKILNLLNKFIDN